MGHGASYIWFISLQWNMLCLIIFPDIQLLTAFLVWLCCVHDAGGTAICLVALCAQWGVYDVKATLENALFVPAARNNVIKEAQQKLLFEHKNTLEALGALF